MNKADHRSLDALFRPRSVAVIGASRKRFQIGHEIVRNLVLGGFQGPVHPVNPKAKVVHSMHCYRKVTEIPGPVDLAVITVPAPLVLAAAKDCGKKGVRGLVVITAGFSEIGGEGTERQAELMAVCEKYSMRVIGPNCMGILNTEEGVSMNASFAASTPTPGGAAFLSQSGALGEAILTDAKQLGIGVSMFASVGNRADVSPSDLLEYWEKDPSTDQILMYLEAFGEPERFMRVARRVAPKKPILVVKSGRSPRGARAAISHTGSLAGSEAAVDSLFNQCGVLRVDTMKDLFALAAAVQTGKRPKGNRVGIVTNAGGPAILATDACSAHGLELPDLTPKTMKRLKKGMPAEASAANPVDLIASADAERFDLALEALLADDNIDMALAIFVSPVMIDAAAVARVFAKHAAASDKPVIACLLGKSQGEEAAEILAANGVPNYRFPEEAAFALAGMRRLQELRTRKVEPAPKLKVSKVKARNAIDGALKEGRTLLKGIELEKLFSAYGIPLVPSRIIQGREQALKAARTLGFPMVAKVEAQGLVHKSDRGGVIVGIRDREELLDAYDTLESRFGKEFPEMQLLLQSMRSDGVETFFGAATDPQFGRMLAFGLGGVHVEVFKDVVFRLHPLSRTDATEMVQGIRAKAMLKGARGKPPVDEEELVETLLRLSRMLSDFPEIEELDLNPFLAGWRGEGSCVLDARVSLDPNNRD
ncbi:MAG: acetate--CoA ligase family protein [Planctomycetota bacterium]